ncbi:hypothetical protein [Myroides indicus]|uniref:Uncharacterized protein n=1 Tax=Myroides indicus TaxID=1323422 RepID=A0A4R7EXI2_9FLAO|nr:hypothetical protein [Myroides indicus]TDS53338.1 hypothetical protein C8P70_12833 [Myroides indicus]
MFTRFDGYQSFLLMLDNDLEIQRNGIIERYQKHEILKFDSSDDVESYFLGMDFNLMIKKEIENVSLKIVKDKKLLMLVFYVYLLYFLPF